MLFQQMMAMNRISSAVCRGGYLLTSRVWLLSVYTPMDPHSERALDDSVQLIVDWYGAVIPRNITPTLKTEAFAREPSFMLVVSSNAMLALSLEGPGRLVKMTYA